MIRVLCTRPATWARLESKILDIRHVQVGQPRPRLRTGEKAGDEMGEVCTGAGVRALVRAFESFRPEVFLFWVHHGKFIPELLSKLSMICPDTLFIHGSGNQVLHQKFGVCWYVHAMRKQIDLVLTNTRDPERFGRLLRWVPAVDTLYTYGFDPTVFTGPEDRAPFDCFFGGGNSVGSKNGRGRFPFSRFRYDLLHAVREAGHTLRLRGGGWDIPHLPGLRGLPYFRDMQQAKIILGTYHYNLERYYTKRTVYGGASGRLFLTRYIPGMEKDFENHKNIVWFRTIPEALDLIRYYLEHDEERERIARATRAHFITHHDWTARLREFEQICGKHLAARREQA